MERDSLFVAVGAAVLLIALYQSRGRRVDLAKIPNVGYRSPLASFLTVINYLRASHVVLREGYQKYKGRIFKVPQISGWLLIATGENLVEELRQAPEHVLSMEAAMSDILQGDYTLGREIRENSYQIGVIRTTLNKNIPAILPDVVDEIGAALSDEIDTKVHSSEYWTPLKVGDLFIRVVCRASNRVFVGLPLCRNEDYCKVTVNFALNVMIGSFFLGLVPSFLKPAAGKLFTTLSGSHRRIFKHLEPIIAERKAKIAEYGPDYPGKPNDLLSWFMDAAPAPYDTAESLALRILDTNFVALHSTSMSFVHALYHLASKPSYVDALRAEVLENLGIESAGWTQNAFSHCWKLDSFLKESQRLNGLGALSLPRKAMRSYTFRDGTTIPEGTTIAATQTATHLDEAYYLDPDEFDGYRFSKLREQAVGKDQSNNSDETEQGQDEDWRHRLTGTGSGYLAFGGGRHVCPGRFFASLELKCMMAYILLRYDVKMEKEGVRPADQWFGPACVPDRSVNVLFRRRIQGLHSA